MTQSKKTCASCRWAGDVHNRRTTCPGCGVKALNKKTTDITPELHVEEEAEEEIRYHCDAILTVNHFPHQHDCILDLGHEDMHESVSGVVWQ